MQRTIGTILITLIMGGFTQQLQADSADLAWKKHTHRDWENSYTFKNDSFRLTVSADVGGRISWFGTPYINLMLTDTNLNGKTLPEGSSWMPWDGCQTDLIDDADQRQFGPIWVGPYQEQNVSDTELVLVSPVHPDLQVQVTKKYLVQPAENTLQYTVTAENRGTNEIGLCIWERALFATPGKAWLPITPEGLTQKNAPASSLTPYDGLIKITPSGDGASVSSSSREGWTAFTHGEYTALLRTDTPEEAAYRNDETCIIYFADNRVELEPLSPVRSLQPGETVTMQSSWHLVTHAADDEDALGTILDRVR